jgi:hypothetical protein
LIYPNKYQTPYPIDPFYVLPLIAEDKYLFKMRAGFLVVAAAAIASGVSAKKHHNHRRHNHQEFHVERGLLLTTGSPEPTCGCTTIYTTITGEGTRMLDNGFANKLNMKHSLTSI